MASSQTLQNEKVNKQGKREKFPYSLKNSRNSKTVFSFKKLGGTHSYFVKSNYSLGKDVKALQSKGGERAGLHIPSPNPE